MTTVAITGHRPEGIPDITAVGVELALAFKEVGATHVIQGMAAGVDLLAAKVAFHEGIPFTCAVPWDTHTARIEDAYDYEAAKNHAARVHIVTQADKYPGPWVYHARNEWMVDNADMVIAVWGGSTKGGTAACVNYALKVGKYIYRINPNTYEKEWLHD